MKKISKYLIIVFILMVLVGIYYIDSNKKVSYDKNFFYMDTYINIKINTNLSKNKVEDIFNKCDSIYKKYQKLTNSYDTTSDLYKLNNNTTDDIITIDNDLYDIINLSLKWNKKTSGNFNINMGSVIKIWKSYRDNNSGIPTYNELLNSGSTNINDIILLEDNKIKNGNFNIDLGGVAKGYATGKVNDYLKSIGIKDYIINAGGNVVVGKKTNSIYNVGIENPESKGDVYTVIKANNKAVVTSGGYERFYEYNGIRYHHIIDPSTLFPVNNMQSVTVVANDSALADILSTSLFLMKPNDAIKYVETLKDVEIIIYVDKDTILKSKGFSKYE